MQANCMPMLEGNLGIAPAYASAIEAIRLVSAIPPQWRGLVESSRLPLGISYTLPSAPRSIHS